MSSLFLGLAFQEIPSYNSMNDCIIAAFKPIILKDIRIPFSNYTTPVFRISVSKDI